MEESMESMEKITEKIHIILDARKTATCCVFSPLSAILNITVNRCHHRSNGMHPRMSRIRYLVLCTRWQKRNIVTASALNSDNVSNAFDLSLSSSLFPPPFSSPCPCPNLSSSVSSSLPLAYLSFCSFLSLLSPSLFPHFSPCRQRRRIMNRGSV